MYRSETNVDANEDIEKVWCDDFGIWKIMSDMTLRHQTDRLQHNLQISEWEIIGLNGSEIEDYDVEEAYVEWVEEQLHPDGSSDHLGGEFDTDGSMLHIDDAAGDQLNIQIRFE
ncbi:hypothetical protein [Halorubrum sp. SY-15]|uniref:hypothetical protein n=1 Tax=Halorubrum sp. SY-15 TaxID=3402277 RepID=UPI003EBE5316